MGKKTTTQADQVAEHATEVYNTIRESLPGPLSQVARIYTWVDVLCIQAAMGTITTEAVQQRIESTFNPGGEP